MSDLEPGHHYQFRVSAVNSEGLSEPLPSLGDILAKDPWGKFTLTVNQAMLEFEVQKKKAIERKDKELG